MLMDCTFEGIANPLWIYMKKVCVIFLVIYKLLFWSGESNVLLKLRAKVIPDNWQNVWTCMCLQTSGGASYFLLIKSQDLEELILAS